MIINENFCYIKFKNVKIPKANVVILHGLGESSQEYIHLSNFLNHYSYNVIIYDIRGHGKSGGKQGDIKHFYNFLDDLKCIVDFVRQKNKLKIFLLGHSMGGIIVNNYLVKYGNVDGAIVSAALTRIPNHCKYYIYLKYPLYLINFKQKKKLKFYDNISNNLFFQEYYPYRLNFVTYRLLRNILFLSLEYLNKNFFSYLTPVLFLYSYKDSVVSFLDGKFIYEKIFSKDKKLKLYQESQHNLIHNIEYKIVFNDILNWLEFRI
ncbi:alpha/beta fold hydrolase [Texas Phoenix palm phytoplasma]|uniref:Alpha/beta fold hydrolase n=1 Tax=Texas Phoenix palm phytoplasma TaxID=176709 RepID=A0ABS5BIG8_9MOLU|nr:alpha/beta fold hydrolase [Texas Phoenix palm phytoplasma]MBP3059378.1 alpha/beta fold hydrolase [Texas Phoenix palm phytoplasma]